MLLSACLGDDVLDMMMMDVRVFGFEKHSPVSSCWCMIMNSPANIGRPTKIPSVYGVILTRIK